MYIHVMCGVAVITDFCYWIWINKTHTICPILPDVQINFGSIHARANRTRARLGRVAPLGRPRSVYQSNLESSFLSRNDGQMIGRSSSFTLFSIPAKSIPRCMLGANLMILAQVCDELSRGQAEFPRILSHNGQNDLEGQGQWHPFSIPVKSIPWCMLGANLVILAQICDELSCGQAKFPTSLSQNGQNDLEGQNQWPLFSIPAESIPGCMFGANLAILALICDELSCGQGKVYGRTDGHADGRTDGQTQATTIPLRPERPWGKNRSNSRHWAMPGHFYTTMLRA